MLALPLEGHAGEGVCGKLDGSTQKQGILYSEEESLIRKDFLVGDRGSTMDINLEFASLSLTYVCACTRVCAFVHVCAHACVCAYVCVCIMGLELEDKRAGSFLLLCGGSGMKLWLSRLQDKGLYSPPTHLVSYTEVLSVRELNLHRKTVFT